jgi:ParB-like chromosome segregation protein Spo0J
MNEKTKLSPVENWEISKLKPFEKNAKLHPEEQIDEICASIRKFGYRKPIEILADGTIINGHGRTMACKKLGLSNIPAIVIDDMSDAEIRAYRIADNKTAMTGFNNELLKEEVLFLHEESDFNMSEFFSDKEFDFLATDLGDVDLGAMTEDLADDVEELSAATQNSIDGEDEKEVSVAKVLGYSKVKESEQRKIALLQAHAEGTTKLTGGAALAAFAIDGVGL